MVPPDVMFGDRVSALLLELWEQAAWGFPVPLSTGQRSRTGPGQPRAALSVQEAAPGPAPEMWEELACGLHPPSPPRQGPPWAAGSPSAHWVLWPLALSLPLLLLLLPRLLMTLPTPSCNYECSSRVSGHQKAAGGRAASVRAQVLARVCP